VILKIKKGKQMKKILFIICILSLASCGKNGKDGAAGLPGGSTFDLTVASTGVDFADIIPGLACFNGGVSIFTFRDTNSDGVLDTDELVIKVKALCNGTNGTNGVNALIALESITASETCPNGGIKFTSGASTPLEVCNGANGVNGEQGFPGIEGIPGIAGSNGTNGTNGTRVAPVKFCSTDTVLMAVKIIAINDNVALICQTVVNISAIVCQTVVIIKLNKLKQISCYILYKC
jgi:hypothetical protein